MSSNEESKPIPYPKGSYFILLSELLERFSYYGMRSLLVLYFTNILMKKDSEAKQIYHVFLAVNYITPLIGAIISDSWLEKFKTIFFAAIVYLTGVILLTISSVDFFQLPKFFFTMVSLALIALGSGAQKPCFTAFAGDQFKMPEQEHMIPKFYLLFYFCINIGSLMSTILTPYLRDMKCLDNDSCYPLSYLVVSISTSIFFLCFLMGRFFYVVKKQPQGNIFVLVFKCILYAIRVKIKSREKKDHWLDHAKDKYKEQLVEDIKITLSVLLIFLPIPLFWALYEQHSSDWTILAAKLNGDLGFYTILPEQMNAINPVSIVLFIPIFHSVIYPAFTKLHIFNTPLQRMILGGILTAAAFVISTFLHLAVLNELPPMPKAGMVQVRGYNPKNTPSVVTVKGIENLSAFEIPAFGYYENLDIKFTGSKKVQFNDQEKEISEKNSYGVYVYGNSTAVFTDNLEKPINKYPRIRMFLEGDKNLKLIDKHDKHHTFNITAGDYKTKSVNPSKYRIEGFDTELKLKTGGVYALLINAADKKINKIMVLKENTISILWIIPQNLVLSCGEILISVTGLEFAYSQAPTSMKSFLQASWNLTNAIGNLIIVLVTSFKLKNPAWDALLYATLMLLDMLVLILIARKYTYRESIVAAQEADTEFL